MAGRGGFVRAELKGLTGTLCKALDDAIVEFEKEHDRILKQSAAHATAETRRAFNSRLSGRPETDPRPGRPTTQGRFASHIRWRPIDDSNVQLDVAALESAAPYWLIQEIGTGSSAYIDPQRRSPYQRRTTVRSQKGRLIPRGLAFGTGGQYTPFGAARGEQLHPVMRLRGAPPLRTDQVRITKEIAPKHYIRDGGQKAYRKHRQDLLAAARTAFTKKATP